MRIYIVTQWHPAQYGDEAYTSIVGVFKSEEDAKEECLSKNMAKYERQLGCYRDIDYDHVLV